MLITLTFCHKNSHPSIWTCRAMHVSKLTLTSATTPQGTTIIHEDSSLFCTSHKHLWDGKSPSDQYPYGTWEQRSKTSLLANLKLPWRHVGKIQGNGYCFSLYDSLKIAWKTLCIIIGHVIWRNGIKCCLCEWRYRTKRQSKSTIILLANNVVARIHLLSITNIKFLRFC